MPPIQNLVDLPSSAGEFWPGVIENSATPRPLAQSEHAFHDLVSAGATDFISPPLREPEVLGRLVRFLRLVRLGPACPKQTYSAEHPNSNSYGIIGRAPAIFEEISKIGKYALSDAAVLIQGETGTGKELFARAVQVL